MVNLQSTMGIYIDDEGGPQYDAGHIAIYWPGKKTIQGAVGRLMTLKYEQWLHSAI
jgi:hypothetical protein